MLRAKKGHRGFVVLMLNNSRVYFQSSLEKTPFFQNISILFGRLGFGLKFQHLGFRFVKAVIYCQTK